MGVISSLLGAPLWRAFLLSYPFPPLRLLCFFCCCPRFDLSHHAICLLFPTDIPSFLCCWHLACRFVPRKAFLFNQTQHRNQLLATGLPGEHVFFLSRSFSTPSSARNMSSGHISPTTCRSFTPPAPADLHPVFGSLCLESCVPLDPNSDMAVRYSVYIPQSQRLTAPVPLR